MTDERDLREHDDVDAAWREHVRDEPPRALDDAIRAAAHRAVQSAPRAADKPPRRAWTAWAPLAVAATLGAIALGVVQLAPRDADACATWWGMHRRGRTAATRRSRRRRKPAAAPAQRGAMREQAAPSAAIVCRGCASFRNASGNDRSAAPPAIDTPRGNAPSRASSSMRAMTSPGRSPPRRRRSRRHRRHRLVAPNASTQPVDRPRRSLRPTRRCSRRRRRRCRRRRQPHPPDRRVARAFNAGEAPPPAAPAPRTPQPFPALRLRPRPHRPMPPTSSTPRRATRHPSRSARNAALRTKRLLPRAIRVHRSRPQGCPRTGCARAVCAW